MSKTGIIDFLGEKALLVPTLLNGAVLANERAKYVLTLLQTAAANADNPGAEVATLRAEREACGIADAGLDRVVAGSEALRPRVYRIPQAAHLLEMLTEAIDAMLAPLGHVHGEAATQRRLADRRKHLFAAIPPIERDVVQGDTIAALTSGRPAAGDGVHLLIMDLHKEINRLQGLIAEEEIEGAQTYGLLEDDRPLVAAFMKGIKRTAVLKFAHLGLATTAARNRETLLIQNDIGENDAHVLVLRLVGLTATLTYTDVHAQRFRFFQRLLGESGIVWEEPHTRPAAGLAEDDLVYVVAGKLAAPNERALKTFLVRLGSRIVFLIDWNRARKRLGLLVPNSLAVELLEWAAEHEIGHRAFLQLGGERLIYDALEQAVRTPLRYGEKLHEMIGIEAARDYLRFVLETATAGLRNGQSQMLIRDRIRAELFSHFRSAEQRLLAEGGHHAAIIAQLALGLRDALRSCGALGSDITRHNADSAKRLESEADEIVRATRSTVHRIAGTEIFRHILEIADDAADALEDAAFLAAVAIDGRDEAKLPAPLVDLAELALEGARTFQRTVETAPLVRRDGGRIPVQTFLEAVDRLMTIEHQMDAKERDVTISLMAAPIDSRRIYLLGAITGHLEKAADSLLRASLTLRDHILGEVMAD